MRVVSWLVSAYFALVFGAIALAASAAYARGFAAGRRREERSWGVITEPKLMVWYDVTKIDPRTMGELQRLLMDR